MLVHRNLVQCERIFGRTTRNIRVFYTLGPARSEDPRWVNGSPLVSRPVFSQEGTHYDNYNSGLESERPTTLTRKLDVFYMVIDEIASKVARGIDVRTAIKREIAYNIFDIEPFPYPGMSDFLMQLLRALIAIFTIPGDDVVTEGVRVRNFLTLCRNLPLYDFVLPEPPIDELLDSSTGSR